MLLLPKSSTSEGGVKQVAMGNNPCKQVLCSRFLVPTARACPITVLTARQF